MNFSQSPVLNVCRNHHVHSCRPVRFPRVSHLRNSSGDGKSSAEAVFSGLWVSWAIRNFDYWAISGARVVESHPSFGAPPLFYGAYCIPPISGKCGDGFLLLFTKRDIATRLLPYGQRTCSMARNHGEPWGTCNTVLPSQ